MNKTTRVLFVSTRVFWPPSDGHKVVLHNYCKGLAERYGCCIDVLAFLEADQAESLADDRPEFIHDVVFARKVSRFDAVKKLSRDLLPGSSADPVQCCLYFNSENERLIASCIEDAKPDFVFVDLIRLAPYLSALRGFGGVKVLYMEDLFSKRYERQSANLRKSNRTEGVVGKYSEKMGGLAARLASIPALQKAVLKMESKRMRSAERRYSEEYDFTVLASPLEADELRATVPGAKVLSIPLGVDYRFYSSGAAACPRKGVVSFLGDMRASANADSLRYIAEEVLPLLPREVVLEVFGACPDSMIDEFADDARILFSGRVADTRVALGSSEVFLAPIAYGTGVKTKILEAMAIGVPVVTNSVGDEGIGLADGSEAFVRDDPRLLADCTMLLLGDRKLRESFAIAARARVERDFQWSKSIGKFSELGF